MQLFFHISNCFYRKQIVVGLHAFLDSATHACAYILSFSIMVSSGGGLDTGSYINQSYVRFHNYRRSCAHVHSVTTEHSQPSISVLGSYNTGVVVFIVVYRSLIFISQSAGETHVDAMPSIYSSFGVQLSLV